MHNENILDVATWRAFGRFPPEHLAFCLKDEYPQTVAVIIAILERVVGPQLADQALTHLPEAFASEVVRRRARLADVKWWVILEVEKEIKFLVAAWRDPAIWTDDEKERWRQSAKKHGWDPL